MAVTQKGAISFGLVYIPVELYTATKDTGISFNQLDKDNHARIKYKKVNEETGKEVPPEKIVKGYQYDKGEYVIVSDDELEKIKTEKDRSIQILQFTELDSIPPVYFEKSYYILPQKGGEKAFDLLVEAMKHQEMVAIGKTVIGSTQTMLALIPDKDGLLMETLHYSEEIKEIPKVSVHPELSKAELDMAVQLVSAMQRTFDPAEYTNEYSERVQELISRKIAGKEIEVPKASTAKISNLMDALKASVEANRKAGKGQQSSGGKKNDHIRKTG